MKVYVLNWRCDPWHDDWETAGVYSTREGAVAAAEARGWPMVHFDEGQDYVIHEYEVQP